MSKQEEPDPSASNISNEVTATDKADDKAMQVFKDLRAPEPVSATPPPAARWIGFFGVLLSGLLGGMIGYGTAEILTGSANWALAGMFIGAFIAATGVGIIANLTLRAMNEWNTVAHPESTPQAPKIIDSADNPKSDPNE